MIKLANHLNRNTFLRNILILSTGSFAAQAVAMVFSPIVTRMYGPEAIGLFGAFIALVAILQSIASFNYPIAIVLPKEDGEARDIVLLSFYLSIIIAVLVFVLILIGGSRLFRLINSESILPFAWLLPLNMLFSTWVLIARQWLIRKSMFKVDAKDSLAKTIMSSFAKIGIGCFSPTAFVLILLSTLADIIHAGVICIQSKLNMDQLFTRTTTTHHAHFANLAKRYHEFPLYRTPTALLNSFSQSLPLLMLASFYGAAQAGNFSLARTTVTLPTMLLGESMRSVFYSRIVKASHNAENMPKLLVKATLGLALAGAVPFTILYIFAPQLFVLIFGHNWDLAGHYASWLSLVLFFMLINIPATSSIPVLNLHKWFLGYEVVSTILRIVTLYIGLRFFNNDIIAISLYSIIGVICYSLLIAKVLRTAILNNRLQNAIS